MSNNFFYNVLVPEKFRTINEKGLKIFASVTMLIDHFALGFLIYFIYARNNIPGYSAERSNDIYHLLRIIGRASFPIYSFMLVEGFRHTRSRKHYLGMLFLFSIISELPFDLAFQTSAMYSSLNIVKIMQVSMKSFFSYQSVMVTLLISLCVIWALDIVKRKFHDMEVANTPDDALPEHGSKITINSCLCFILCCIIILSGCLAAYFMKCDYSYRGVITIVLMYIFMANPAFSAIVSYMFLSLVNPMELYSFPAFILILMYNGQRGHIRTFEKYCFYSFYPIHLMLIFILRACIL